VENKNFQFSPLFYIIAKEGNDDSTNQVPSIDLNYAPLGAEFNNSHPIQGFEPLVISYTANQSADS